jgi:hypothetical protein
MAMAMAALIHEIREEHTQGTTSSQGTENTMKQTS